VKRSCVAPVLFLVLTLLFLPARVIGAQAADPAAARAQADAWLLRAETALADGSGAAPSLIDSAVQLAPDYSECLYLRARLESLDRPGTRAAIDDLRASLRNGSWTRTDPDAARRALAAVLLRTGALPEAQALLEDLTGRRPEDADALLLLARLSERSGDAAREQRVLSDAAARFPLRDEFRLLAVSLSLRRGAAAAARVVVATGLKVNPDSLPLLLASARLQPTAAARRSAADLYIQKGGTDPLAAVIGLESGAKDQKKYLELFLGKGGLGRQDLVGRAAAAVRGSASLAKALGAALGAYSGTRDLDIDAEGFWAERWTFEKGTVTGWVSDPARDGVPLYSALFVEGTPSELTWRPVGGPAETVHYSRYPSIASVEIGANLRLYPVPYTLQCAFLDPRRGLSAGLAPLAAASFALPTVAQVEKGSYRRDDVSEDGVVRTTQLSHGLPVYAEEDTNGDGVIDHKLWYTGVLPVRGQRSLAGSGRFGVKETWRDGKLAAADFDVNGDGVTDYREQYGSRRMKQWDNDADGRWESREYPGPGDIVVREISTRGNGVFDLRMEWKGPRITRVARNGVPASVTADARRGVTWIGKPAADGAAVDSALPDGIQLLGGREYLVFRFGGITYAEVVK
jgi:hypothetical protein